MDKALKVTFPTLPLCSIIVVDHMHNQVNHVLMFRRPEYALQALLTHCPNKVATPMTHCMYDAAINASIVSTLKTSQAGKFQLLPQNNHLQ